MKIKNIIEIKKNTHFWKSKLLQWKLIRESLEFPGKIWQYIVRHTEQLVWKIPIPRGK